MAEIVAIEPRTWYNIPDWEGAVRLTFEVLSPTEVDRLLRTGLPRLSGHVRIIDAILFHIIRPSGISAHV